MRVQVTIHLNSHQTLMIRPDPLQVLHVDVNGGMVT